MKKLISLLLVLLCLTGITVNVSAETGFETLYGLFCSEEVFDEPDMIADGDADPVCFAIFLFDPEYDITRVILIGCNEEGAGKYIQWQTDYEPGAQVMTFLVTRFADFKVLCGDDIDFCISFSFDEGQTMTNIDTLEAARNLMAALQDTAEEQGDTESVETVEEILDSMH